MAKNRKAGKTPATSDLEPKRTKHIKVSAAFHMKLKTVSIHVGADMGKLVEDYMAAHVDAEYERVTTAVWTK